MASPADVVLTRHPELVRLGTRPRLGAYLRDLWQRREFAWTVPVSELRALHMNTVLGNSWHVLNPLLSAGIYYLVFGVVLGARAAVANYPSFLIIGIFVYYYTQRSVSAGSRAVVTNMKLIQSLTFPRAILPIASALRETIAQGPVIGVLIAVVLLTGEHPHWGWLGILPAYALQAMFNVGLALAAGRATFHFRDVEQLLPYLMRIWFYLSGIFFTAERLPEGWLRTAFQLNPMHVYIHLARELLRQGAATPVEWGTAAAWALGSLVAGFLFFQREEGEYGRGW
jgi:teichoic acid transport system permease protein